jgi:hypothetical protein
VKGFLASQATTVQLTGYLSCPSGVRPFRQDRGFPMTQGPIEQTRTSVFRRGLLLLRIL